MTTSGAMHGAIAQLGKERVLGALVTEVSKSTLKQLKDDRRVRLEASKDR